MVHVQTLQAMEEKFRVNLKLYIREHPGEYVLFEQGYQGTLFEDRLLGIKATFYKGRRKLERALAKYKGCIGPTFLTEKIPVKTHRFNENNRTLEFRMDEHITVCPNDRKTRLIRENCIYSTSSAEAQPQYHERAHCPDCGYKVFRKPSEQAIREAEKRARRKVFAGSAIAVQ